MSKIILKGDVMIDLETEYKNFENTWLSLGANFNSFCLGEDKMYHLLSEVKNLTDSEKILSLSCINTALAVWLIQAREKQAEIDSLKAQLSKYENKRFFSHDFNGDGFQYHDTLEEAKKEAEAGLDWYRDRVADGHHVEDDGEFKELCYGIVLASADYNIDDVVTKEHHMNDEWTQYEVGTEILSLELYEESVKAAQENSHE